MERAQCQHCGNHYIKRNLKPAPDGGAICKDWFKCQQRCDKRAAQPVARRFRSIGA